MHTSDFFRLYVSTEKGFNRATPIEAQMVGTTHNVTKPQVETTPQVALVLVPISFIIVWASVVFIVANVCKVARGKNGRANINPFKQVPCKNCRFFNNNHHLKCAVHPSTALTKEALNCSDYWPQ